MVNVSSSSRRVLCREIEETDIHGLVDLLMRGLPHVPSRDNWVQTFQCLSRHRTPTGFPKYGYLLECEDAVVGVILLIHSSISINGELKIRCNESSWCVEPTFRSYASLLALHGRGRKDVTHFNLSPGTHTLANLEARGYVRYCSGWFASLPALSARSHGARIELITTDWQPDQNLVTAEIELLLAHASYGCISLTCSSGDGTHPFVFVPLKKSGIFPYVHLIYCRDVADFVRFARPLGRFLVTRGFPLVTLDANGPVRGLVGKYFVGPPKYFKGPDRPRLGDLAYSELAMFPIFGERTPLERLDKKLSSVRHYWRNGRSRIVALETSDGGRAATK
jgi:hypothetical protein